MEHFEAVTCTCGAVLLEVLFEGLARVKCGGCKRRVWVAANGDGVTVGMVDSAPRRIVDSRQLNSAL